MRRFLMMCATLATLCGCGGSGTKTAAEAPIRVVGRVEQLADGAISFDWSGVYIDIRFKGSYLAIELSDTKRNYFNLTLDGVPQEKFISEGDHTTVVLFNNPEAEGEHHIRIQKATEAEQGRVTLHSLTTDGRFLATDHLKRPLHIEYYGDSLTCGYGTERKSGSAPFLPETENCCYSYAAVTAAHFDSDYNLVSHSGRGLVRNYGDSLSLSAFETTMSGRALRLYDEEVGSAWDFQSSSYRPDAIVITLSTNDFSTPPHPTPEAFVAGYKKLISTLRESWGNDCLPVLCVVHSPAAVACVSEMVKEIPHTAMADISWGVYNRTTDLGASEHPNRYGQEKMAAVVIEALTTLTGW